MRFIYLLLLSFVLVFSSCQKEKTLTLAGTWLLVDGYLYVENMETGDKIRYDHFGRDKTVSHLSGFKEPSFLIETIEQNVTTWEIKRGGDFILNGDTARPMYVDATGSWRTIIEHPTSGISMLGGSARPFRMYTSDYETKRARIFIQEQVGSYDGYNMEWESELIFIKIEEGEW